MLGGFWARLFGGGSQDVGQAWLHGADGKRWPVKGSCSLGRSTDNDVLVEDQGVSRRHALINKQGETEYWIIDLGSGNGTHLNDRRVTISTRLKDKDVLRLGEHVFTFRQKMPSSAEIARRQSTTRTIINVKTIPCWLIVADIKGSTTMAQQMAAADMAMLVGGWMDRCKSEIIEANSGTVNKYLGDGFLAYWRLDERNPPLCLPALQSLVAMQRSQELPRFRVALHLGQVAFGGGGSLGEESLSGLDLIYVFRMEKLAAQLGCDFLVSEAAGARLAGALPLMDLGMQELTGIDGGLRRFYGVM